MDEINIDFEELIRNFNFLDFEKIKNNDGSVLICYSLSDVEEDVVFFGGEILLYEKSLDIILIDFEGNIVKNFYSDNISSEEAKVVINDFLNSLKKW